MSSIWAVARELKLPLDTWDKVKELPYTISYVIRKRVQIDNMSQLPKEKRPPELILWDSNPDKLDEWLDKVLGSDDKKKPQDTIYLPMTEIE